MVKAVGQKYSTSNEIRHTDLDTSFFSAGSCNWAEMGSTFCVFSCPHILAFITVRTVYNFSVRPSDTQVCLESILTYPIGQF